MYGTELGSVIRQSRSNAGTPNERAVSIVTGSTSRTPYIVCTSIGQKAPNVARKTSLLKLVPSVRKSSGISAADGIGRRNSIGTRNALRAEVAQPERDPERDGEHRGQGEPDAPSRARCGRTRSRRPSVCAIDHSSPTAELMAGRSRCGIAPVRERSSQNASAETIERTKTSDVGEPGRAGALLVRLELVRPSDDRRHVLDRAHRRFPFAPEARRRPGKRDGSPTAFTTIGSR